MGKSSSGGFSIGTILIICWVLFGIFDDDEEDKTPKPEVTIQEETKGDEIKTNLKKILNDVKEGVKDIKDEITPEAKEIAKDVKEKVVKSEPAIEPEEEKKEEVIEELKEESEPEDNQPKYTPL